ncbi:MAG: chromate efflux transporter [Cyclobacteriaceae bacterium]|nr:chromate efflux transporter [Cyclobacteriaceae bacterium]
MEKEVTLKYLLLNFLKIGATSFGGFIAMVSVIQDQMVTKNKVIKNEIILDGISLASVMPGPLAVNVVTYIGYQLKGIYGALISMMAVILPSYILVLALSWSYLEYGTLPLVDKIFSGIMPAVVAIIVVVAIRMTKKSISDYKQWIICILSGFFLISVGGFFITLGLIFAGGLVGYVLYYNSLTQHKIADVPNNGTKKSIPYYFFFMLGAVILGVLLIPQIGLAGSNQFYMDARKLMMVFGGMSVTLFGGGYVFIPAIQETVVQNLHWLTIKEFTDSIAIGQITPGPILISATFIGYKVAGFWGSIVATVAIFLPSGLLMIIGSHFLEKFKRSNIVNSVFMGLRPAVIGLIFAASFTIGKSIEINWQSILIFTIVIFSNFKYKVNAAILIPVSGILGSILYSL